jgi:hypothetical protein
MIANYARTELTDTGHCLNETVSGKFLMMAEKGNLVAVCSMIQERAKITAELRDQAEGARRKTRNQKERIEDQVAASR